MPADLEASIFTLPDPRDPAFQSRLRARLVADGLLDELAARRTERAALQSNQRFDTAATQLGLVSDVAMTRVLGDLLSLPVISSIEWPDVQLFRDEVPEAFLMSNRVVVIGDMGEAIKVAVADPFNSAVLAALAFQLERPLMVALAPAAEIDRCLERLCGASVAARKTTALSTDAPDDDHGGDDVRRLEDLASEAPIVRLVHDLIVRAVEGRASDIHIEPRDDSVLVRYRIDGALRTVETLPVNVRAALSSRVKIMAGLNIAERRLPQDGRIKVAVRGREIDLRVSTMPTLRGESVVLRILDRQSVPLEFAKLGFSGNELKGLQRLLTEPNGIILVTGPTGSGKSTTLYAALSALNGPDQKLFTVEDPIEYQLTGVNQIAINPKIGLSFASALRSILRQDPDIIMVGEIRDLETAQIAIRASLTGHLVLSTVHTNSAASTITRLLDMGVEDYLLASSLKGVLAQRLVRRLCDACSRPAELSPLEVQRLTRLAVPACHETSGERPDVREPVGCPACQQTGFRGRTAIYELLPVSTVVRERISAGAGEADIEAAAVNVGMVTLLQHGISTVLRGETSLREVLRVTRYDDAALPL